MMTIDIEVVEEMIMIQMKIIVRMMMTEPQVIKIILLIVYRAEGAFLIQSKRFLLEDDAETSLHNDPELLLTHKLKSKVLAYAH